MNSHAYHQLLAVLRPGIAGQLSGRLEVAGKIEPIKSLHTNQRLFVQQTIT